MMKFTLKGPNLFYGGVLSVCKNIRDFEIYNVKGEKNYTFGLGYSNSLKCRSYACIQPYGVRTIAVPGKMTSKEHTVYIGYNQQY